MYSYKFVIHTPSKVSNYKIKLRLTLFHIKYTVLQKHVRFQKYNRLQKPFDAV